MKQSILVFVAIAIFSSCSKDDKDSGYPPKADTTTYMPASRFIDNWHKGDTLYTSYPTQAGIIEDTMFTDNVNDTSFIIYKGVRYYIWAIPKYSTDTLLANDQVFSNVAVSRTYNVKDAISYERRNNALPYKYVDKNGKVGYQKQWFILYDVPKMIPGIGTDEINFQSRKQF